MGWYFLCLDVRFNTTICKDTSLHGPHVGFEGEQSYFPVNFIFSPPEFSQNFQNIERMYSNFIGFNLIYWNPTYGLLILIEKFGHILRRLQPYWGINPQAATAKLVGICMYNHIHMYT